MSVSSQTTTVPSDKCDPEGACAGHGRCWTHSEWADPVYAATTCESNNHGRQPLGCSNPSTWICNRCGRTFCDTEGAADDHPSVCDDCWVAQRAAAPSAQTLRPPPRTPLLALGAAVLCLFCPGHLLALAGLLGLAAGHAQAEGGQHHTEVVALGLGVVALGVVEWFWHRRSHRGCRHG